MKHTTSNHKVNNMSIIPKSVWTKKCFCIAFNYTLLPLTSTLDTMGHNRTQSDAIGHNGTQWDSMGGSNKHVSCLQKGLSDRFFGEDNYYYYYLTVLFRNSLLGERYILLFKVRNGKYHLFQKCRPKMPPPLCGKSK